MNKNAKLSPADLSPASTMFIIVPVLNRFGATGLFEVNITHNVNNKNKTELKI